MDNSDRVGFVVKIIGYILIGIVVFSSVVAFFSLLGQGSNGSLGTSIMFVLTLFGAWWSAVSGNKTLYTIFGILIMLVVVRALLFLFLGVVIPAGDYLYRRGDAEYNKFYNALPRKGKEIVSEIKLHIRQRRDFRRARREEAYQRRLNNRNNIAMRYDNYVAMYRARREARKNDRKR